MAAAFEVRITAHEVYGKLILRPANKEAFALAAIAGTKTLTPEVLKTAKRELGAVVLVDQRHAALVSALLT